jgi:hypothetical protein
MERKPFYCTCGLCGMTFQFGPGRYDGKHIPGYNLTVCKGCYDANWDGWAPQWEAKILQHLHENGLPVPAKNSQGLLPRDAG